MNTLRILLAGLSVGLLACPDITVNGNRPDGGRINDVRNDAGTDAGVDAGTARESLGTFTTDAGTSGVGLTVNTAILSSYPLEAAGPQHQILLLETEAERAAYCAGEVPAGNQQTLFVYPSEFTALSGTYTVPSSATIEVPFTNLSYGGAGSGSVNITEGEIGEYVIGTFESAELYDVNMARVGGAMSGTFVATSCPPQPHFAGSGANSASGSFGFAVAGAVAFPGSTAFPYYLVYLTAPDSTAGICAGEATLAPNAAAAILYIPMPEQGLPSGSFDLQTSGGYIERFDTDAEGWAKDVYTSFDGTITVTGTANNTLSGTYEAKLAGHRGQAETLSGTFSAPFCP